MTLRRDAAIATPAALQDGVVSRAQLRADLSDRQITRALAAGLLVPVHEGVFRHAAVPLTERGRLRAALLNLRLWLLVASTDRSWAADATCSGYSASRRPLSGRGSAHR